MPKPSPRPKIDNVLKNLILEYLFILFKLNEVIELSTLVKLNILGCRFRTNTGLTKLTLLLKKRLRQTKNLTPDKTASTLDKKDNLRKNLNPVTKKERINSHATFEFKKVKEVELPQFCKATPDTRGPKKLPHKI